MYIRVLQELEKVHLRMKRAWEQCRHTYADKKHGWRSAGRKNSNTVHPVLHSLFASSKQSHVIYSCKYVFLIVYRRLFCLNTSVEEFLRQIDQFPPSNGNGTKFHRSIDSRRLQLILNQCDSGEKVIWHFVFLNCRIRRSVLFFYLHNRK